jgi:hypothetical protein
VVRACPLLVVLLLAAAPGLAQTGGYSHTRDGWVYGFNIGWGWAQAEARDTATDVAVKSGWVDDLSGGLRLAFAPDDTWTYGLDLSAWSELAATLDETVFWVLAQVRWFPGGQGFYVHGGAGAGALKLTTAGAPTGDSQSGAGFAWGAGAGYEVRVKPTVALGLTYDYRDVTVGELSSFDDVATAIQAVTVAVTWYLD